MASSRCLAYTPRLGQMVCVFALGTLVGHYMLRDSAAGPSIDDVRRRHPRYRCVELSGYDAVDELGASLDDMNIVDNSPDVSYDVASTLMENRKGSERGWHPDVRDHRVKSATSALLGPGMVTNVVHYLWCEVKIFEFQHYLSVLSVVTHINPQRIVFHYVQYPRHDNHFYNTWFEDMKKEFMYISLKDMTSSPQICSSKEKQIEYISAVLKSQGGIYVHYNTVFLDFPLQYRRSAVVEGLTNEVEGFLVAQQGVPISAATITEHKQCIPAQDYRKTNPSTTCVIKRGPYYPRDAWFKKDDFSKEVNMMMYQSYTTPRAAPSEQDLVPNIGHVFWADGNDMPFLFYLNCLSYLYILKVDKLYIHGNVQPKGKYWDSIKTEPNVTFVKIVKPDLVFRKQIGVVNHMSDLFRGDVLLRHGGIYSDTDSVWIKPIPVELRRYDVVASYDWPIMYNAYPDYINFGATLSKPGARFWYYFLHAFKDFKDDMFGYNGLLKPYKVFERHPELVHIYDKLQVMCWELRCHPTWYPDFRGKDVDHRNYPDFDWKEAHLFHWTDPTPQELTSEEELKNSDTIFAQIGKHVLRSAGRL